MRIWSNKLFLVLLIWCAGLGAAAQFAKIAVPFALIRDIWPGLGSGVGWLLSVVSLLGAVLGLLAGAQVARFGARQALIFGLVVGGCMSFWQASLPGAALMIASRVIEGISHLAIVVAAPTLIAHISAPRWTGAAMALWSTFFGVAFAVIAWGILPFLGPGGVPLLFLGHGLFLVMLALLAAVFIPGQIMQAQPGRFDLASALALHRRAYRSPEISASGAGWLFYTLTFVSLLALMPTYLPPAHADAVTGFLPLLAIATSLLVVPVLLRRFSSVAVVMAGFVLAAALMLAQPVLQQPVALALCLFAILGLIQGGSFSAVAELTSSPEDQALAYGLMAQAGNIGNLLGTPLLLLLLDWLGETGLFLSVGGIYLIGFYAHLHLAQRRRRAL